MNINPATQIFQEVTEQAFYAAVAHRDMAVTHEKGTYPKVSIYKFKRTDIIFGKTVDGPTLSPRHVPRWESFFLAVETLPSEEKI